MKEEILSTILGENTIGKRKKLKAESPFRFELLEFHQLS